MNNTFRTVWNAAIGAWVAVSETTHARGKRSSSCVRSGRGASAVLLAAGLFGSATVSWADCTVAGNVITCIGATPGPVTVDNGAVLNNTGTLGIAGSGVTISNSVGGATVNNSGSIIGDVGVSMKSGGTVNNPGGIIDVMTRGIEIDGAAGVLNNTLGGRISAETDVAALFSSFGTVLNTGNSTILSKNSVALSFAAGGRSRTQRARPLVGAAPPSMSRTATSA